MKTLDKDLVLAENELQAVREEVERLNKAKDALQSEIEKKTADYNIHFSGRDAESKRKHQDVLLQSEQLVKDKQEFQAMLQQFQKDKAAFSDSKKTIDIQNAKYAEQINNVQQFLTAIKRAYSVLGI
jgi:archaellum component FlaC